jgi:D-lactate dehydrogenase
VGVIGTGKIGLVFARIMRGFGCTVIGHDPRPDPTFEALGGSFGSIGEIVSGSDVISLHCPLTVETAQITDEETLVRMKPGSILINTSRGGLVDTDAAIHALKTGRLGGLAIDVYEQGAPCFSRTCRRPSFVTT